VEGPLKLPLILASGSPRRRVLLRNVVSRFRVVTSHVPEPTPRAGTDVRRYVLSLAKKKALSVAQKFKAGLALGADTLVTRRGTVYGKPVDRADAHRILSELSGKWHEVYTWLALALCPRGRVWTGVFRSRVQMRRFTAQELHLFSKKNHDKAGAYAAQARGNPFVLRYEGDYNTIVGLPLKGVRELLVKARQAGYSVAESNRGKPKLRNRRGRGGR
jgi:septum formation protein